MLTFYTLLYESDCHTIVTKFRSYRLYFKIATQQKTERLKSNRPTAACRSRQVDTTSVTVLSRGINEDRLIGTQSASIGSAEKLCNDIGLTIYLQLFVRFPNRIQYQQLRWQDAVPTVPLTIHTIINH